MFKKMGIGLLLTFTMFVSTFNVGIVTATYATELTTTGAAPCNTLEECRELQRTTRDSIADIIEEEEELSDYIEELQNEITDLRDEIDELEDRIDDLETETADLSDEIEDLAEEIEKSLEALGEIESQIEDLIEEISQRMRIAQRVNNTNSFLSVLSEAENIADFVRRARTFNRFAAEDAESLEELLDLIDDQESVLFALEGQRSRFQEQTDQFGTLRSALEAEQVNLEAEQVELIDRETDLQDKLYELNLSLTDEEDLLAAITEAEDILSRTPAPITMTSSNAASLSQTPNASGLAHPMPGARVTSEFGPRWGSHHAGIDLVVVGNPAAPILSSAAGTVTINRWHNSLGWYIVVSHSINGQRVDTLYAHLRYQSSVRVGTIVSQGQRIGTKGNTGRSTGPHLHYEVHPGGWAWGNSVNPRIWVNF